ncbi:long-chain-fatty-acid--CoA ligase 5 [Trichonephila clavipes]|nr:long-chain-fatty-acid--CoA ligase 5 [Trichonephila clavipes]
MVRFANSRPGCMTEADGRSTYFKSVDYQSPLFAVVRRLGRGANSGIVLNFTRIKISSDKKSTPRGINNFVYRREFSFFHNVAPNLIELCKQLSRDQTTLNSLEMSRTTACYKMKYGLAKTIKENIIKTSKEIPFSLNLDESTSNAQESILAILVQFYDNNQNEVVVHHLASLKMESCNSEAVFKAVVNTIEDNNIPWANLISVSMDSCNTMRGKKGC